jgi:ankyrin repeat protein
VALCVELQPALRAVADRTGALPLHWASRIGASNAILSYLVGNDENAVNVLNAVDASGWSALHFAVYNSRVDVVKWLLQAGCVTHIPDKQGRAALDLAEQRENPIILDILQQVAKNAN